VTRDRIGQILRLTMPPALSALAAAVVVLAAPSPLLDLDRAAFDAFVRQTPPPAHSGRVVVVAVDEASLDAHGQWPWPRDVLANLVAALARAGAAAVAFDLLFPEPDRLGVTGADASGPSSTDAALAAAMADAPVAAGFALTFDRPDAAGPGRCASRAPVPVVRQRSETFTTRLFQAISAVCNIPRLSEAARTAGTINVSPDDDGVLRRIPVIAAYDGWLPLTLGVVTAALGTGTSIVVDERADGTFAVTAGPHPLELDEHGQLVLRPRGPGHTFPYLSAADVLRGAVAAEQLRDRIVFVGATALGVRDTVATALDPRFPGVELHATVADTVLIGQGAVHPPFARAVEIGSTLGAAALASLAVMRLGGVAGSVVMTLAGLGTWLALRAWFAAAGVLVSPAGAGVGLAIGGAATIARELALARRRAAQELHRRQQAQRLIVQSLTSLTETRDVQTGRHARRTQEYTRLLATALAARGAHRDVLTPHRIDLIATLAPLHDIGKVGISDAVLNKPGQLTAEEYAEMKRHTELGHETLRKAEQMAGIEDDEVLALAKDIVFTHHERWDGSGYPRGLRGDAIPLAGRLVAVVDTYDALIAERPYKAAMSHDDALAIIRRHRGIHFDPDVVDAFLSCHTQFSDAARAADVGLAPAGR
jgi:adenylate cyclase